MDKSIKNRVEEANKIATERILKSRPLLIDIKPAIEVMHNMKKNSIFHAGPPIEWKKMCGPMKGAIVGTMIYEGYAESWTQAVKMIEYGEIEFSPNHDHDAVGPMAGVISPSMPVLVVKNETYGNICYGRFVENKVQFGLFDRDAVEILKFWSETLAPVLARAIRKSRGMDLKSIMAKALHMGDELHNRPAAGTLLFASVVMPYLIEVVNRTDLVK